MSPTKPVDLRPSSQVRKDIQRKQDRLSNTSPNGHTVESRLAQHLNKQEDQINELSQNVPRKIKEPTEKEQAVPSQQQHLQEPQKTEEERKLETILGTGQDDEMMYRLMIHELNSERRYDEVIHQLTVDLPEWQDYNNEVLRTIKQVEIERVCLALEARLQQYDQELEQQVEEKITSIMDKENLTRDEMTTMEEYKYLFEDDESLLREESGIAGKDEKDEFDLALERSLALDGDQQMLDVSQIPEEAKIMFHKALGTTYKRKDIQMEHEFSMEPMMATKKATTSQSANTMSPSTSTTGTAPKQSMTDENDDFDLSSIIKGLETTTKKK
eukprot:gene8686-10204_t